jgi:hypothetical protein
VTERGERLEVASRPAAEIEDRERRVGLDGSQQRFDVLADVVIARAFAETLGMPVVVFQREAGDFFQVVRSQKGIVLPGGPIRNARTSAASPRPDSFFGNRTTGLRDRDDARNTPHG